MPGPFCPVTGKRHPPLGSAKFTPVCRKCKTQLLLFLSSDDDLDDETPAHANAHPAAPSTETAPPAEAVPPAEAFPPSGRADFAQPAQPFQATQLTPRNTTASRPLQAGQALTGFNDARAVALVHRNSPNPNDKPTRDSPAVISVTLEVFAADVDVVTIGGQETRRWTEVGSINSCLPVKVTLHQLFSNHEHIIRFLLDLACKARKLTPTEFRFVGKLSAGRNKKVMEMTSLDPDKPVTFHNLCIATTNRTKVKMDENVSLYLLKEKLHYIEREEREDPAPLKTAKRPRSETQSSSKVAKGLDVLSKKVKLEQEDETESEQEREIKEESETSDTEGSDDSKNGDNPFASPDPPVKQEVKEDADDTSSDDEEEIQVLGEETSDEEKVTQSTTSKRVKDWSHLGPALRTRRRHSQE